MDGMDYRESCPVAWRMRSGLLVIKRVTRKKKDKKRWSRGEDDDCFRFERSKEKELTRSKKCENEPTRTDKKWKSVTHDGQKSLDSASHSDCSDRRLRLQKRWWWQNMREHRHRPNDKSGTKRLTKQKRMACQDEEIEKEFFFISRRRQ